MIRDAFASLSGARILVTGASGFVGANLTRFLLAGGLGVDALSSRPGPSPRLDPLEGTPGLSRLAWDLRTDPTPLIDRGGYDIVFHLASAMPDGRNAQAASHGQPDAPGAGGGNPRFGDAPRRLPGPVDNLQAVNVAATLLMARALARRGGLLLFAGSVSEYAAQEDSMDENTPASPATPYGRSKVEAVTGLARLAPSARPGLAGLADQPERPGQPSRRTLPEGSGGNLSWCVLRLFGVYGPLENPARLLPYIASRLSRGEPALLTHGRQIRDFVFVEDVAKAFVLAAVSGVSRGRSFNIGSGTGVSVGSVARMAGEMLGRPDLLRFGAVPDVSAAPEKFVAEITRARTELGWEPRVSLGEGVSRTIQWATSQEARP